MINKLQACRMGSERGEERKLPGCLLTLLTVTDSYLTATVFVGSIHYGFCYIQHEFQAIIKVHVLCRGIYFPSINTTLSYHQ